MSFSSLRGDPILLSSRIPPFNKHDGKTTLPSLSSLTAEVMADRPLLPSHWQAPSTPSSYRPPQPQPQPPASPMSLDVDATRNMVTATTSDRVFDPVNVDDPDVRLAAQALGDLRADFLSKTPDTGSLSPRATGAQLTTPMQQSQSPQAEPLLSLLVTTHPLLASTIGGASSAYGGAKNFSPRFKTGAEYVEGYLTPIANTVNSVGRVTGVENGVRWFLGRHAPPSEGDDPAATSNKRRKVANDNDMPPRWDDALLSRRPSVSTVDTLPAYDDMRSPAYSETGAHESHSRPGPSGAPWQARLMISTSGLSVAMSNESLRSLRYCLQWLRWTNDHMRRVIDSLKAALDEYEKTGSEKAESRDVEANASEQSQPAPEQPRDELVDKINSLKSDILKTLKNCIKTVSQYAGGALPENARTLVRRHLTSLPQRYCVATMYNGGSKEGESAIRDGAQKVLLLAKEGLDMVTQISGVVDGTIVSAEEWCERMGRKRHSSRDDEERRILPRCEPLEDAKVGIADD